MGLVTSAPTKIKRNKTPRPEAGRAGTPLPAAPSNTKDGAHGVMRPIRELREWTRIYFSFAQIRVFRGFKFGGAGERYWCWFAEQLAPCRKNLIITVMKLALAVLVYVLIGVVLGAGILLTVAGKPWFLIAAIIVYVVAFGRIGCMTH